MTITLCIPGKPIAKKRPRFFRKGKSVGTYNAQETEEGRFMWAVRQQLPPGFKPFEKGVPLKLTCLFAFEPPASVTKKKRAAMLGGDIAHVNKPDTDNMIKFILDCLNTLVWHDDTQVVGLEVLKAYGQSALTAIKIEIFK